MIFRNQIIVILCCYFVSFFFVRSFIDGINHYQLNRNAYKKIRKGESIFEWLFYSRFKEGIPKIVQVLYFTILFIHPICIVICSLLNLFEFSINIGEKIAIGIYIFDFIWTLIIALLFWNYKTNYPYERWITKKRGQSKKKK